MKSLKFSMLLFIYFVSFSGIAQLDNKKVHNSKIEGNLVHTVFFWLNNPESKKDRKAFEKGVSTLLNQCKSITSSHIGTPANTAKRPVIDASYTYCIVVTFDSKEAHDQYQNDPIHLDFVNENKDLWKKVLVYDSKHL